MAEMNIKQIIDKGRIAPLYTGVSQRGGIRCRNYQR